MTTPLWDHQREALRKWVEHDCKGYVDMATATGKTVLGLAAVALLYGQLHPDDATTIFSENGDDNVLEETDYRQYLSVTVDQAHARVLVVAGQELILEQWQSEFDEHLNIPRERTRVEGNTMRFPSWGSIEFRTAPDLLQMDTLGGYNLVILDEAHQYKRGGRSGGWRTVLEELAQKSEAVLAMSGSIDTSWQGDSVVKRMLEEHLHEEGVIQFISCHELGSARVFTQFVVRDGDDHSKTQSEVRLYPRMDAASGAKRPEAAV